LHICLKVFSTKASKTSSSNIFFDENDITCKPFGATLKQFHWQKALNPYIIASSKKTTIV
jgi:hypothetical protein